MKLQLNNKFSLGIESYKERIRLIVYKNDSEFVCRKETEKNLKQFLCSTDDHIFKGRLRLFKKESSIVVTVKGEVIGIINDNDFLNFINNARN